MSFDWVAPHYRWLETLVFGNQLQKARLAFVRQIESPRRVLIVGEGNGRFLAKFARAHPAAAVDCIEASERMIALARARTPDGRVKFIYGDLRDVSLEAGCYDLVVTHFVLDCFCGRALRAVVEKLASAATEDAIWLLADFRLPDSGWRNFHAQLLIRTMYFFFRLTSGLEAQRLDDPSPFLQGAGFRCTHRSLARCGMIKSEFWQRSA